jgi:serine/threonine protein kinase
LASQFHRIFVGATEVLMFISRLMNQIPLCSLGPLGGGGTAMVDKVMAKGQVLARKTIKRGWRGLKLADARVELRIMRRLQMHKHIIKVLGSYTQELRGPYTKFAMLLHPVATDLEVVFGYLQCTAVTTQEGDQERQLIIDSLATFIGCLANALMFIHKEGVRHKDIKSQNILVAGECVFFGDFGISHDFSSDHVSVTQGKPKTFTPIYSSPELAGWSPRGRSSDIFSLGCVFLEIMTIFLGFSILDFERARHNDDDDRRVSPFQSNLDKVHQWIEFLRGDCERRGAVGDSKK